MAYKIRVQKKKEIPARKLASRSEERLQALLARPKLIWGSLAVLVLIALASFAWRTVTIRAEEAAWRLETEASKLFHEPPPLPEPIEEGEADPPLVLLDPIERLKRSAELYDEIIEKYPTQSAAMIARFESGNVYYALEAYDSAEERLKSFLERHPDQAKLGALAHLKLAYLYLKKEDLEAAKDHLRTVYEMADAANKDQAGFELARVLEAEGNIDEALAIYGDVSARFEQSPWGTEAKVRLTLLNPPTVDETVGSQETGSEAGEISNEVNPGEATPPVPAEPEAAGDEARE